MNLLQGTGAVSALLGNASNLVRELRRPGMDEEAFASILREELNRHQAVSAPQAEAPPATQTVAEAEARIRAVSREFVARRDANGDGHLSLAESGLSAEVFNRLDTDGDGRLSAEELARPSIEALYNAR